MPDKQARADVAHIRQTTQFTCCAASIAAALKAHGKNVSEDDVNKVLGAAPMAGATWEAMLATVQYFGLRGSLVVPATPRMLKGWTDQGLPVLIAWNPENRPWSHASVVFDVVEGADGVLQVHVMDPNIPNPSRHVRVLDEDEFCQKWGEKVSDTLIVRRPAMVVEREVTVGGRQVVASTKVADAYLWQKEAEAHDCYKDYKSGGLTWEEYQDCLKRFKDEEGDAWRSSRPRIPTTPVPPDYSQRAGRLLMALWFADDKGRRFVKDNLYKSSLSDKQMSWFESLERKYSRVIADMPDRPPLSFPTDGSLWIHMDRLTDAERAKLEKHFFLDSTRGRGREWAVRPKAEAPAPAVVAPAAPNDSDVQKKMLAVLDTLIRRTNNAALRDFKRDLEMGKVLTEDQLKAIRHNLYKSNMRSEADLFRTASLREAGEREVERLGDLRAFWLFNSARQRVYGILDSNIEGDPEVGMIVWDRKSNTWKVEQWLDTDQNYKRPLGSFTASDAREGVKRALLTFQDQRMKLAAQQESPVSKSAKAPTPVTEKKDPNKFTVEGPSRRNPIVQQMIERGPGGAGKHHTRERDVEKGQSRKEKHKKDWREKDAVSRVADRFLAEQE